MDDFEQPTRNATQPEKEPKVEKPESEKTEEPEDD